LKRGVLDTELAEEAKKVLPRAYAPYSGLKVGAAVRAKSGALFSGANVENASFGLTVCAEQVAICKAVAGGERDFESVAIVTEGDEFLLPCGACRQFMSEFSRDLLVYSINGKGEWKSFRLSALYPKPFGKI